MEKNNTLHLHLSASAKRNLENIFHYTLESFGKKQAIFYVNSFAETFVEITSNPSKGRPYDHIKKDLIGIKHKHHFVFYRIKRNSIWIVTILHEKRDFIRHFS